MKKVVLMSIYPSGIRKALALLGYEVVCCQERTAENREHWLKKIVSTEKIDLVFSFDFDIAVAKICRHSKIMYASWIVDCPHAPLYCSISEYDTNRIFVFDHNEYLRLRGIGRENVFYFPLATDVIQLHETAFSNNNSTKWTQDVAFMGNLYDDSNHSLFDQINYLPNYVRGYLEGLFRCQMNLWGVDLFSSEVIDHIKEDLLRYIRVDFDNKYHEFIYKVFWDTMFCMKVAQLERKEMCDILSEEYDFALYTGSDTSYNSKIKNYGYIDYLREMPVMFHSSKININLNLHCISSGIPLRIIDIMACEGFCLTNYQPELYEYFVEGEDFVAFSDFEEMREKIDYYLQHEDERRRIARNGYEKVKKMFDYSVAIPKMMQIIEDSYQ